MLVTFQLTLTWVSFKHLGFLHLPIVPWALVMSHYFQEEEEEKKILSLSKYTSLRLKVTKAFSAGILLHGPMTMNYFPLEQWVVNNLSLTFKILQSFASLFPK